MRANIFIAGLLAAAAPSAESLEVASIEPRGLRAGRGELTGMALPTDELARAISEQVGRSVRHATGLNGLYDFKLTWTPDQGGMTAMPVE